MYTPRLSRRCKLLSAFQLQLKIPRSFRRPYGTVRLQLIRFAEVIFARSHSPADFANEFAVSHKLLVFLRLTDMKPKVVQIAQVLLVAGVRQIRFCHDYCSQIELFNNPLNCQSNRSTNSSQPHFKNIFSTATRNRSPTPTISRSLSTPL